jgi:hypothetical protein
MLRIVNEEEDIYNEEGIVKMSDMLPLQVGTIVGSIHNHHIGKIIMRTASKLNFEVMSITNAEGGNCWSMDNDFHYEINVKVKLLPKGEKVTIELYNE